MSYQPSDDDRDSTLRHMNEALDSETIAWLDDLATGAAKVASRRWGDLQGFQDWRAAAWQALLQYPVIRTRALELDTDEQAASYAVSCVLNELHKVALNERAKRYGGQPSDQAFYTSEMIAAALPRALCADPAEWGGKDTEPDPDELQRGGGDPSKGGTRLAVTFDVQEAYSHLPLEDAYLIRRYYVDRCTQVDLAQYLEVSHTTIQRKLEKALGAMVAYLGGDRPTRLDGARKRLSSTERYACRCARSNADSIRELMEVYSG